MTDESKKALNRIGSLVDAIGDMVGIARRMALKKKLEQDTTVQRIHTVLTRTVWSTDDSKELLGWTHESIDTHDRKTLIQVHMIDHSPKYLVVEYTVTDVNGVEREYRSTWAEGLQDVQITIAALLNLEHPEMVVFE